MTDSGTADTLHEFDASDRGDCNGEPAMTPIRPDTEPSPLTPPPRRTLATAFAAGGAAAWLLLGAPGEGLPENIA